MLNKSGIRKTELTNTVQILANVGLQSSVGCIVDQSAGISVGDKTIVKAGTPVTGSLDSLTTAFTPAATTDGVSNAVGIMLHDVDVTDANANATLLLFGFVNKSRIDATTLAKITKEVETALGMIKFMTV